MADGKMVQDLLVCSRSVLTRASIFTDWIRKDTLVDVILTVCSEEAIETLAVEGVGSVITDTPILTG